MLNKKTLLSLSLLTLALCFSKGYAYDAKRDSHINSNLTNNIGSSSSNPVIYSWHSSAASARDNWVFNYQNEDKSGNFGKYTIANGSISSYFTGSKTFHDEIVVYCTLPDQVKQFVDVYGAENLGIKLSIGANGSISGNNVTYSIANGKIRIAFTPVLNTANTTLWQGTNAWNSMSSYGKIAIPRVKSGYGKNYLSASILGLNSESIVVDDNVLSSAYKSGTSMKFNSSKDVLTSVGLYVPLSDVTVSATVWDGGSHGVYFEFPINIQYYDATITSKNATISDYEYQDGDTYWVRADDNFSVKLSAYSSCKSNVVKVNSHHLRVEYNGASTFIDARLHSNQNTIADWRGSNTVNFNSSLSSGSRDGNTLNTTYVMSLSGDKDVIFSGWSRLAQFNSNFTSEKIYRESRTPNKITVKSDSSGPTITFPSKPSWITGKESVTISVSDSRSGVSSVSVRYRINNGAWSTPTSTLTVPLSSQGKYEIEVRAVDNVGNITTAIKIYNVDTIAPDVSLDTNTDDWTNKDVAISVAVKETGSGVDIIKWANGDKDASYFRSNGTTVKDNLFKVSAIGTYSVYVKDNAGNETVETIYVGNIDKAEPSISLSSPPSDWTNSDVTVSATITTGSKTGSGNSPISVKKYAKGTYNTTNFPVSTSSDLTSDNTFLMTSNGTYTVYVRDEAGNSATKTISTNYIDKDKPTISGDFDNNWVKGNKVISFTANDSLSGLDSLKLWNSSKTTVLKTGTIGSTGSASLTYTVTEEGITKYKIEAIDNAGNSLVKDVTVKIDNTNPTAKISLPEITDNKKIEVSLTNIKDVHSGVKEVWISEDEDFTKGVQKHALTSANSQKVNYTLVVKSTFLEHFADRTVYVKLIDNVGNYSIYSDVVKLVPKQPDVPKILNPIEESLYKTGQSLVVEWTYNSEDEDLGFLPQLQAEINFVNLEDNNTYTYLVTGNINTTQIPLSSMSNGEYQVTVSVYNYLDPDVFATSEPVTFRYNKFKDNGNVLTKKITTSSPLSYLLVNTKADMPTGTNIKGYIYYEMLSDGTPNKKKSIEFEIKEHLNTSELIKLPTKTNSIVIEYFLTGSKNNMDLSPVLDHLVVLGK